MFLCDPKTGGCGKKFSGERSFDKHRTGDFEQRDRRGQLLQRNSRRCMTDSEMLAAAFEQNDHGVWVYDRARRSRFSVTRGT